MGKRLLNSVAAVLIALAVIAPAGAAAQQPAGKSGAAAPHVQIPPVPGLQTGSSQPDLKAQLPAKPGAHTRAVAGVYGETDPDGSASAIYIVQLEAVPLASYLGGLPDLAATSPSVTGSALDMSRAAESAYASYLSSQQSSALAGIQQALGRQAEVKFTYQAALNGFALVLTPKEAARVAALPGVKGVQRDFMDHPLTDYGPTWIGAPTIWNSVDITATHGEGVVVGILDTGINFQSPSFARVGGDGYIETNPRGRYYGVCDSGSGVYNAAFTCSEKLIGAWDFADGLGSGTNNESDGPADNDGHGSHTASTVAGDYVSASLIAPTLVVTANVSGVAPHANIIAYDVCLPEGCPGSALIAGLNRAVLDGVDVINYSIGGSSRDPWESSDAQAMLAALNAGIFVAASAGNDGPNASTMGSPANAPWVTAAGASTHNRRFTNKITGLTSSGGPLSDITGMSISGGVGPAPIVRAEDYTDTASQKSALCTAPYAPGTFTGKIVLCKRGTNGRVEKGSNVLAGGAAGMILMNDQASGSSLMADAHVLSAIHISYTDGEALSTWLATGSNHRGTLTATTREVSASFGDIMASFSSRGPDATSPDVLKPDITAPGVDILAATKTGGNYEVLGGTSMASPHLAGSAALLLSQHPGWTPAEVRSAIMLAAADGIHKEDGTTLADPFDDGAGRIDLGPAAHVGFVLDQPALGFELANPSSGGEPSTLNLASLANSHCVQTCTWTRTVRSVIDASASYTTTLVNGTGLGLSVQPSSFTLGAGATQVLTVTADVSTAPPAKWVFGSVKIVSAAHHQDLALPVAVQPLLGTAPSSLSEVDIQTRRSAGVYTISGLQAVTTSTLVTKLYVGVPTTLTGSAAQDPTNSTPWDISAGGVYTHMITITNTETARLAVQIKETTATDLDLYVGYDANSDGQPEQSEVLCTAATASALEFCDLANPVAGNYWILVDNWEGSGAALDTFTLEVTQVTRSNQSAAFTATGPASATTGVPFSVGIHWDEPALSAGGIRLGLLEIGTSSGHPHNVASLPVKLERLADDVRVSTAADAGAYVKPGQRVDFTITLDPEPTAASPTDYVVTATIPSGLTYLPGQGKVRARSGTVIPDPTVSGNQLIWHLDGVVTTPRYVQSTNDPTSDLYSASCIDPMGIDGFVHLENYGIGAKPLVSGDGQTWDLDALWGGSGTYAFYGQTYPKLYFSDDAVLSVVGTDPSLHAGANAPIPTAALPNNLLAPLWGNFRVVYDAASGKGVHIASMGGGSLMFLEYRGLQSATTSGSVDVEAIVSRAVSSTRPEIIFAYDGISGTLPSTVTGLENAAGTAGVAYTGTVPVNNRLICYDWKADQIVLSYATTVDANATSDTQLVTRVTSELSAAETKPAVATVPVFVTGVDLAVSQRGPARVFPDTPITYTLTVTNTGTAAASSVTVLAPLPLGSKYLRGGTLMANNVVSFTLSSLAAGAHTKLYYGVELDETAITAGGSAIRAPEIIGGGIAGDGAWPWQAALWSTSGNTWWGCGGSLVAPGWVLTAAHCVVSSGSVVPASSLGVVLGINDLTQAAQGQRIRVTEIFVHPDYNVAAPYDSDVALLRLKTPATLNAKVQLAPLATADDAALYAPSTQAIVTGWGTRTAGHSDYPNLLYQVTVPIVSQDTCGFAYTAIGDTITANMLCAGLAAGGKDSCQGDSGGPLVVPNGDGWKQAGVVSWGQGCARPGLPGVYTRMPKFIDYVSQAEHTLTGRACSVTDGTGLAGHSATAAGTTSTWVNPIRHYMPMVTHGRTGR